jgi:RHS repeat-associated protein
MRIKHIIITALVILGSFTAVFGQRLDNSKLSPSLASSDSSDVNVFNGKISLKIPLITIRGRGEVSLPLYLIEPSTQMTALGNYWYADPQTGSGQYYPTAQITGSQMNPYIMPMPGIMARAGASPFSSGWGGSWMTKLAFESSDGSRYEFFDTQPNSQFNHAVYHKIKTENGINVIRPRGQYFSTKDGSDVRFVSDTPIYDILGIGANAPASSYDLYGYINFPNGTVYRIDKGFVSWMEDKNGNRITVDYNYGSDLNLNGYTVTDSIGRKTIVSNYRDADGTRIEYTGSNGANRLLHILYGNVSSGHPDLVGSPITPDIQVWAASAHKLILPDGRSYKFFHNTEGLLTRMETPIGGAVEYSHSAISFTTSTSPDQEYSLFTRVTEKRVYKGSELVAKTTYSFPETPAADICWGTSFNRVNTEGFVQVKNYSPNVLVSSTKHYFTKWSHPTNCEQRDSMLGTFGVGQEYKTEFLDASDNVTRVVEKTWENRESMSWWKNPLPIYWGSNSTQNATVPSPYATPSLDARIVEEKITLVDSNQVSKKTYQYDPTVKYNLVTDVFEYDYGQGQPGSFLRRTHTDYIKNDGVYDVNYGRAIRGLVTESWVSSDIGGGNIVSRAKYEYDNYSGTTNTAPLIDRTNITGHDAACGTNYTTRGNATKITTYADAQNQTGAISVHSQYDIAGNVVKVIDAKGYESTVDYNDNFGTQNAEARTNQSPTVLNGLQTFAFATSATNDAGYTTYAQFDYYSGAGVDTEDINGNISTTYYNDILDRPTQTISANNRPDFRRQMTAIYQDNLRKVTITSDSKRFDDNLLKSESFYDGLGRTFESREYENTTNYVAGLTQYDSFGRAYKSSNPYRPYLNEQPVWTTSTFDSLGRVTEVKSPDNGKITRSYSGSSVRVFDQAGRSRAGTSDALGRLLKVVEYDNGADLETLYNYDVLGRLRKTTQGTQNRFFMYNDLGRLIRAKQTEQLANTNLLPLTDPITGNSNWSVAYSYDNNGNVASTTDSRNKTITGTYDNLNRLTLRDYSDTTPDVSFAFDNPSIPNSKGQLTSVSSSVSANFYTAFDEFGRIKSSQQVTNGTTYNFPNYTYDLSGALVQQTYPSGRVVKTESDAIGRLSKVTSQIPTQVERTYLNNLSYTAFGGVSQAKLGNGRWESMQFDSKTLQTTQIGLGFSATNTNLLKIEYNYGTTTATTSDNNGSLRQQKISYAGQTAQITQNYTYDMLNRLKSATETVSGNANPTWKQTFNYDIYGNRRFDAVNTTTLPANNGIYNPNIGADNKFLVSEGYNYDSEGNLTSNPESQLFQYDAENRQTQVTNTVAQTTANYQYDGSGKRVRKTFGNEETIFVYDAFGKMIAEYSNAIDTTRPKSVSYLTTDALGSPRIVTDATGNVISRHDYMPFGEEVMAGTGGRMTTQGYAGNDGVKQQFTGYERDGESGLDYAQARYFSSKHGRFTSVDPLTASASMKNPQTFNRYSYVGNSPYKFTDPLGLRERDVNTGTPSIGVAEAVENSKDATELSQSQRNQALTQLIFDRASQGYATDMGAVTGSMIGYTATDINNNVSGNFSVSSGILTMTNVQTTTVTRFRSDGTQIGQPKVTTRTDTLTLSGTSGTGDCMNNPDCAKDSAEYKGKGPTPIGSYTINTKSIEMIDTPKTAAKVGKVIGTAIRSVTGVRVSPDWGSFRIPLNPNYSTQFRDGAYLHGGSFPGTIGCVDIGGGEFGDSRTRSVLKMLRTDSDYSVAFTVSN